MNKCNFIGRLTKDPELKSTNSGKKCLNFCLAVRRRVKGDQPVSDFIDCIAWEKTAEIIAQYCGKGSLLGVSGQLQTRTYEKGGEKRKAVELVVNEFDLIGGKSSSSETAVTVDEAPPFEPSMPFEV